MARVSSDEQAKGYSLDVQTDSLIRHCNRENIQVVKTFREDHSAKDFNRPEFTKFLQFAKQNRRDIDYLLFTSWDRFSRNITDAFLMIRRLNELGIEPRAIEQPLDLSIPESKAMLAIYLAIPEIDNDRRSMKIKGGIRGALKAGRWCRKAPMGYRNSRDMENKPLLVPNEDADHIRFMFTQIIKGRAQVDIKTELASKGFRVSKNGISKVLKNPVYMGKIVVPASGEESEELVEGVHDGLVTESVFRKVNQILDQQRENRATPARFTTQPELLLRGFLNCSSCGQKLTGSRSRSATGKRYHYYHCNYCGSERHRADSVNETVETMLNSIQFKKEPQELYKEIMRDQLKGDIELREKQAEVLEKEILKQEDRLGKLQDLLMDDKLSHIDYNQMRDRCVAKIDTAKLDLHDLRAVESTWDEFMRTGINLLADLRKFYSHAQIATKRKLLRSIFPENLIYDGSKCRTPRINEILRLLLLIDGGSGPNEKGQLHPNLKLSPVVEPGRFELPSKQRNVTLSSCLVLT